MAAACAPLRRAAALPVSTSTASMDLDCEAVHDWQRSPHTFFPDLLSTCEVDYFTAITQAQHLHSAAIKSSSDVEVHSTPADVVRVDIASRPHMSAEAVSSRLPFGLKRRERQDSECALSLKRSASGAVQLAGS